MISGGFVLIGYREKIKHWREIIQVRKLDPEVAPVSLLCH